MGVPVVGAALTREARRLEVGVLVIAVPSAPVELLRELSDLALEAGLHVRVLPPLAELFGSTVGISDIRPLTEADLLGRHEIDTDIDAIAGYLTGRRVLVTGAGGSIGSELSRQIARFAPDQLVLLDRDESALHTVQLMLEGRALLDSRNLVVADIRDLDRMHEVFNEHRPEVVFHAAALKHLPLLEMHPSEAVKTNVYGSWSLLDLAAERGVDRFINISTDKAADPTSVLGYTKRLAEMLTADVASRTPGTFLSVRFGNVLGSRGSVLTAFQSQIAAGGPVTVTDPEVTRYFMTVEEAVQLVIQAGAVGRDGGRRSCFDMGTPCASTTSPAGSPPKPTGRSRSCTRPTAGRSCTRSCSAPTDRPAAHPPAHLARERPGDHRRRHPRHHRRPARRRSSPRAAPPGWAGPGAAPTSTGQHDDDATVSSGRAGHRSRRRQPRQPGFN
jgi:FlaA1/EpsC-like NDP-sugar epimerase